MMSMSLSPQMIMGMACTVCGLCDGAGKNHASDTDVVDHFVGASKSSDDIPTAVECPKCGKRVYPSYCVYLNKKNRACVRQIDKIKNAPILERGPFLKWVALQLAKQKNELLKPLKIEQNEEHTT